MTFKKVRKVCPVEIKLSADPGRGAIKNFSVLDGLNAEIGPGAVVCLSPILYSLDRKTKVIPIGAI